MWQYVVYELLVAMLNSYSEGISHNIKKNIDNLLIPDDIFTVGKSVCYNFIEFKQIKYKASKEDNLNPEDALFKILIDNELEPKKMQGTIQLNTWSVIAKLLKLFSYEKELHEEVSLLVYPRISEAT